MSTLDWVLTVERYAVAAGCLVGAWRLWPRRGQPRSRLASQFLVVLATMMLVVLSRTPGFPLRSPSWPYAAVFGAFGLTLWVFVWPRRRR
jgi:hypothetical protein